MPSSPPSFAALLLAGGRSRRMGQDKALLEWDGHPLWRVQWEKLISLQPARTWIAARNEQKLSLNSSLGNTTEWLYDPPGEDLGPIAAIGRALRLTDLPLLVLAVDTPLITADLLRGIASKARSFFYRSAQGIEPLPGLYAPAMRPLLEQAIKLDQLSLQQVIQTAADQNLALIEPLPPDTAALFENANTPGQWTQLQARQQPD